MKSLNLRVRFKVKFKCYQYEIWQSLWEFSSQRKLQKATNRVCFFLTNQPTTQFANLKQIVNFVSNIRRSIVQQLKTERYFSQPLIFFDPSQVNILSCLLTIFIINQKSRNSPRSIANSRAEQLVFSERSFSLVQTSRLNSRRLGRNTKTTDRHMF